MGANFDFTVSSTRFTIGPDATVLGSVMAFIRIDSIALETREDFTLSLVGGNDAARAALRAEDPNTFAFPSIQVIIEDMDGKCCIRVVPLCVIVWIAKFLQF